MYLEGGHAYVYLSYGMHWCLNVVTQEADIAEAVLIRAAEPVKGIDLMRERRPKAKRDFDLMNGPGKVCAALAIDRMLDGAPLDGGILYLTARHGAVDDDEIIVTPRIGVENSGDAAHWPLRFLLRGNRYVSAYRNVR
jgi:DNA-3-methyladenine glycosylase